MTDTVTTSIINIAAYKFINLPEDSLEVLRGELKAACLAESLKGTILLSCEGVNMNLSGDAASIEKFWDFFTEYEAFSDMTYKVSPGAFQPFKRMTIKLRKEIITMGREEIKPAEFSGPRMAPRELKRWLDEGKDFILLDTRNDYEIRLGTFAKAQHFNIKSFGDFPDAVDRMDPADREKPVVMFCTGGIRCEKASPLMINKGFQEVYQLEGGILKYFEECNDEHFDGECFVFDHRVGINGDLSATGAVLCERCNNAVNLADQKKYNYEFGKPCPRCPDFPGERLID